MFRVAAMAGVLRAEGTSSEGSEEDREKGREIEEEEEEKEEGKRIYSIPGLRFP